MTNISIGVDMLGNPLFLDDKIAMAFPQGSGGSKLRIGIIRHVIKEEYIGTYGHGSTYRTPPDVEIEWTIGTDVKKSKVTLTPERVLSMP